jgi:hypothetical protein
VVKSTCVHRGSRCPRRHRLNALADSSRELPKHGPRTGCQGRIRPRDFPRRIAVGMELERSGAVRVRGSDGRRCYSPRAIPSQRFTVSAAGDNIGWNHGCISGPGVRTVSSAALHPVRLGLANRREPRYWNSTLSKLRSPLDQQCSAPDPMTGPVFRSRWLHPSFAGSETERVPRLKKRKGPAVLAAGRLGALQLGTGTLTCGRHRGHHRHGIRPHHGIHRRHGSYPRLGIRDHH